MAELGVDYQDRYHSAQLPFGQLDMDDVGIDVSQAQSWFTHAVDTPYVLVSITAEQAAAWASCLGLPVRRCYITDEILSKSAIQHGIPELDIIAARLPDAGSTMSGDFGELLAYFYQAVQALPQQALGVAKWRLKQDRTKPAPHSDVVHFIVPKWPDSSAADEVLCSEVKAKATAGDSNPISSAIDDSLKDRTSRLTRTLVWLRERAMTESLGPVTLKHLERFINATDHPPAQRRFRAVAVISEELLQAELTHAPAQPSTDYSLLIVSVPQLRTTYTAVFAAARQAAVPTEAAQPVAGDAA